MVLTIVILVFQIVLSIAAFFIIRYINRNEEDRKAILLSIKEVNDDCGKIKTNYLDRFDKVTNKLHSTETKIIEGVGELKDELIGKIHNINLEIAKKTTTKRVVRENPTKKSKTK